MIVTMCLSLCLSVCLRVFVPMCVCVREFVFALPHSHGHELSTSNGFLGYNDIARRIVP